MEEDHQPIIAVLMSGMLASTLLAADATAPNTVTTAEKAQGWKLLFDIQDRALRKLRELAAAPTLETLHFPPSNRLHPLLGDRKDSHAIRINDQWRITFTWGSQGPENVSIKDYH